MRCTWRGGLAYHQDLLHLSLDTVTLALIRRSQIGANRRVIHTCELRQGASNHLGEHGEVVVVFCMAALAISSLAQSVAWTEACRGKKQM